MICMGYNWTQMDSRCILGVFKSQVEFTIDGDHRIDQLLGGFNAQKQDSQLDYDPKETYVQAAMEGTTMSGAMSKVINQIP